MENPEQELRILILEDVPTDAELMQHALSKAGLVFQAQRVDTRAEFERALEAFRPDIVLADFSLPAFTGGEALHIVCDTYPGIPVIIVTGALGDEAAVALVKQGARDYVLKDSLARLGFAVRHALEAEHDARGRRAAEQALADSEARFRAISTAAPDAVMLIDDEGRILYWNPAAERILGYSAQEALGRSAHQLVAPSRYHADSERGFAQFHNTGEGAVIDKTLELEARRKDGAEFPVELSVSAVQLDHRWHAVGILRDITERKQAEAALRESEAGIRALVERSPIAMLVDAGVERDEKIEVMNRRFTQLFGYTMNDVPDIRHWWPLAYPDETYRKQVRAQWLHRVEAAVRDSTTIEPMEATVTCRDGSQRYVRCSYASIGTRNIVAFEDLTERRRTEEDLKAKTARLERFNRIAVGRELDMIRLKEEINALLAELGRPKKYGAPWWNRRS